MVDEAIPPTIRSRDGAAGNGDGPQATTAEEQQQEDDQVITLLSHNLGFRAFRIPAVQQVARGGHISAVYFQQDNHPAFALIPVEMPSGSADPDSVQGVMLHVEHNGDDQFIPLGVITHLPGNIVVTCVRGTVGAVCTVLSSHGDVFRVSMIPASAELMHTHSDVRVLAVAPGATDVTGLLLAMGGGGGGHGAHDLLSEAFRAHAA